MILKLSSNSTHSVNKLLEDLGFTDNTCPSLFFSETLMLLEPTPAAAELCTAQEQRAESQEQKVLRPFKTMGENSPGALPSPNVGYVQSALVALPVFPLSLTTNKCLSIFVHSFHSQHGDASQSAD